MRIMRFFKGQPWTQTCCSQTFRAPLHPSKIPGHPAKRLAFMGLEGHTELPDPHPFAWKTPHPTGRYPDAKVCVCAPFLPDFWSLTNQNGLMRIAHSLKPGGILTAHETTTATKLRLLDAPIQPPGVPRRQQPWNDDFSTGPLLRGNSCTHNSRQPTTSPSQQPWNDKSETQRGAWDFALFHGCCRFKCLLKGWRRRETCRANLGREHVPQGRLLLCYRGLLKNPWRPRTLRAKRAPSCWVLMFYPIWCAIFCQMIH